MTEDGSSVETVYRGSDGAWYTRWQVDRKLLEGSWKPCLEDRNEGVRLVGYADGEDLVMLVPVDVEALPAWLEVRSDGRRARVVDTRRGPSQSDVL